ncbi:MAG TPA: hypothetical protein VGB85_02200 [Nannocystis sp.]|jgi:hypothetical protein
MPSLEHEALVEMFRTHPELVPLLLREVFGVEVPAYERLVVSEAVLDQLTPTEFRADLVVDLFDGADKRPRMSGVVEVQLRIDDDKLYSWPAYLILSRSRRRCEAFVLVVAPDPAVAAWARRPIHLGPGNELRVFVLGPAEIPTITDPDVAARYPELTVLSALAHGNEPEHGMPVLRVMLGALRTLDRKEGEVYLRIVYKTLAARVRHAFQEEVMLNEPSPDVEVERESKELFEVLQRIWARDRAAKASAEAAGEARGFVVGQARALLKILDRAGIALSPEHHDKITSCEDPAQLDAWIDRAFDAKSAADLFG